MHHAPVAASKRQMHSRRLISRASTTSWCDDTNLYRSIIMHLSADLALILALVDDLEELLYGTTRHSDAWESLPTRETHYSKDNIRRTVSMSRSTSWSDMPGDKGRLTVSRPSFIA